MYSCVVFEPAMLVQYYHCKLACLELVRLNSRALAESGKGYPRLTGIAQNRRLRKG
jgi:hypothetical protein